MSPIRRTASTLSRLDVLRRHWPIMPPRCCRRFLGLDYIYFHPTGAGWNCPTLRRSRMSQTSRQSDSGSVNMNTLAVPHPSYWEGLLRREYYNCWIDHNITHEWEDCRGHFGHSGIEQGNWELGVMEMFPSTDSLYQYFIDQMEAFLREFVQNRLRFH